MHTLWRIISSPFKWSWRFLSFIRELILNLFLIAIIIVTILLYLHLHHITPKLTKGALVMNLAGIVVDKPAMHNKFRQFEHELLGSSRNLFQENSLFDVVDILRQAKNDANITGLVLLLKDFAGTDQPSLQYIGKALREFRDNNKPIYAIGNNYSQAQYFLASYANKIYLTPQGSVDLHGIATNRFYYNSLLDKLKVNSHIFRVGTYKSVAEPFLRDNMSDAARDADGRWVGQLWQQYLNTAAANRQIMPQQLFPGAQTILAGLRTVSGDTAKFALNNKLVDEVASYSVIEEEMIKAFGWNKKNKSFNATNIYDYQLTSPPQRGGQIAVIFANGAIIDGPKTSGAAGGDHTADHIRNARLDPDIKAIILRVNSPGGSVSASELIRSELAATRDNGKPIVVSMSGMAASGGYWISTPANIIIASESTLTGSIGIFGMINTVENSLGSIGVHTDGVTTSPLADVSMTKTLPTEFAQMMQLNVENSYKNFITLVAQSRHKTLEEIDKIAQGRVWIGNDALENGLVDNLGDFDDAVNKAAKLANLKEYQLNWYMDKPSLMDILLTQTSTSVYAMILALMQYWLPVPINQVSDLLHESLGFNWNDPKNCYAVCLSCGQKQ
ncbi:MAG: protease IV, a signal peptide peptidase [Sodalis sp. Fse]|nr:MAG: protease IV, a signal peptide peptidase [Sodalis sp. Fse]